jgi:hypothetical protein
MAASQVQTVSTGVTAGVQLIPNLPAGGRTGYLHLVQISALGVATATITLYDSTNSTTNPIYEMSAVSGWSNAYDFLGGLAFKNGVYAVVAGTGGVGRITFE